MRCRRRRSWSRRTVAGREPVGAPASARPQRAHLSGRAHVAAGAAVVVAGFDVHTGAAALVEAAGAHTDARAAQAGLIVRTDRVAGATVERVSLEVDAGVPGAAGHTTGSAAAGAIDDITALVGVLECCAATTVVIGAAAEREDHE